MPDPGLMTSKVRSYMEALSPSARKLLMRAMQQAKQRGEGNLSTDEIMKVIQELAPEITFRPDRLDEITVTAPLEPWDQRFKAAFFEPLAPFLCPSPWPVKQPGRIHRDSIAPIWTWLYRDLAPGECGQAFAAEISNSDPAPIARRLRGSLVPKILGALRGADVNSKDWRRLAVQVGGEPALQDLGDIVSIFECEAAIASFVGQMPRLVSCPETAELSTFLTVVKRTIDDGLVKPHHLAVLMMPRVGSPAVIAAIAMRLAGTNDPRLVQSSAYAAMVETVIGEVELRVARAGTHIATRTTRAKVCDDLRAYHDVVRQLDLVLRPDQVPAWHKRLGAARKGMSELIGKEIEPVPGLIRRAMRVEAATSPFGGSFDRDACEDAEYGVRLMQEARNALDSLALNELVTKTRRQIEQTLEAVTAKLMADYKSPAVFERSKLLSAVDAAIRMSATVFGEDYANTMRKSRDSVQSRVGNKAVG